MTTTRFTFANTVVEFKIWFSYNTPINRKREHLTDDKTIHPNDRVDLCILKIAPRNNTQNIYHNNILYCTLVSLYIDCSAGAHVRVPAWGREVIRSTIRIAPRTSIICTRDGSQYNSGYVTPTLGAAAWIHYFSIRSWVTTTRRCPAVFARTWYFN